MAVAPIKPTTKTSKRIDSMALTCTRLDPYQAYPVESLPFPIYVVVDKSALTVRALDGNGKLISFYPASVGSEERPSPSGTRHIRSVVENPTYHYSPKLKFKGVKTQKPFDIAPGPMNPVGSTVYFFAI